MYSSLYNNQHHQQSNNSYTAPSHHSHGPRSRRAPRHTTSQNSNRQYRNMRPVKEEAPAVSAFRLRYESSRCFDDTDDLEFCPDLLTEDDLQSIHSSSSDRSSLSSGSPNVSPVQPHLHVTPSLSLSSTSNNSYHSSTGFQSNNSHQMKIHQPAALRTRNAIPIVNPNTGMRVPSPPSSISPARMHAQTYTPRW